MTRSLTLPQGWVRRAQIILACAGRLPSNWPRCSIRQGRVRTILLEEGIPP